MDSLGEGGAEQNLLTLVQQLGQEHAVHGLAWLYDDDQLREAFRPYVDTLVALRTGRYIGMLPAAVRLAREVRKFKPDLLHAKLIRSQLLARLAARLAGGVPVMSTWECVSYDKYMYAELGRKGPALRELTRLLDIASGLGDKHFVAVSEQVAAHNARKLRVPPQRVSVVYNAFEPTRVSGATTAEITATRHSLGLGGDSKVLLAIGRPVHQKGYETAIDAMPALLEEFPGAVLLIAGKGPLEQPLRSRAEQLGVQHAVRLLGRRDDVPVLLAIADVYVSSSYLEGHSIALLEGLAAGLPAVLSEIDAFTEVATGLDSVRFFPAGDAARMAAVLGDVLKAGSVLREQAALSARRDTRALLA